MIFLGVALFVLSVRWLISAIAWSSRGNYQKALDGVDGYTLYKGE